MINFIIPYRLKGYTGPKEINFVGTINYVTNTIPTTVTVALDSDGCVLVGVSDQFYRSLGTIQNPTQILNLAIQKVNEKFLNILTVEKIKISNYKDLPLTKGVEITKHNHYEFRDFKKIGGISYLYLPYNYPDTTLTSFKQMIKVIHFDQRENVEPKYSYNSRNTLVFEGYIETNDSTPTVLLFNDNFSKTPNGNLVHTKCKGVTVGLIVKHGIQAQVSKEKKYNPLKIKNSFGEIDAVSSIFINDLNFKTPIKYTPNMIYTKDDFCFAYVGVLDLAILDSDERFSLLNPL